MGYAFEMYFDSVSERKIRAIWSELANKKLPVFMLDNACRPHISLSVYDSINVDAANAILSAFCRTQSCFRLFLGFIGVFTTDENVVFAAPAMTEELMIIHRRFHDLSSDIDEKPWVYYIPDNWQPHCTMAEQVPDQKFCQVLMEIKRSFTPAEVIVESIGIVEFAPTKLINEHFLLKNK